MDNVQEQLNRIIDAYCLQAKYVERLEQAILIANKAADICTQLADRDCEYPGSVGCDMLPQGVVRSVCLPCKARAIITSTNKAMDICRRVDKYFNSEKQWPTGTLEAIYRDAAIVVNAATNKGHHLTECDKCTRKPTCGDVFPACTGPDKDATDKGKGGTIGGDRDIGSESKEKEEKINCVNCAGFQDCYFKPVTEKTPADDYDCSGAGDCNHYKPKL